MFSSAMRFVVALIHFSDRWCWYQSTCILCVWFLLSSLALLMDCLNHNIIRRQLKALLQCRCGLIDFWAAFHTLNQRFWSEFDDGTTQTHVIWTSKHDIQQNGTIRNSNSTVFFHSIEKKKKICAKCLLFLNRLECNEIHTQRQRTSNDYTPFFLHSFIDTLYNWHKLLITNWYGELIFRF